MAASKRCDVRAEHELLAVQHLGHHGRTHLGPHLGVLGAEIEERDAHGDVRGARV